MVVAAAIIYLGASSLFVMSLLFAAARPTPKPERAERVVDIRMDSDAGRIRIGARC